MMDVSITFNYPDGIDDAIERLEQMRPVAQQPQDEVAHDAAAATTHDAEVVHSAAALPTQDADVVRMHRQMEPNESRRLLEALTSDRLTFAELALRMPKPDGSIHTNASMRAIFRNVRRREITLTKRGVIQDNVVKWDWDHYDEEGAGRYYLDVDARAALDAHLGR